MDDPFAKILLNTTSKIDYAGNAARLQKIQDEQNAKQSSLTKAEISAQKAQARAEDKSIRDANRAAKQQYTGDAVAFYTDGSGQVRPIVAPSGGVFNNYDKSSGILWDAETGKSYRKKADGDGYEEYEGEIIKKDGNVYLGGDGLPWKWVNFDTANLQVDKDVLKAANDKTKDLRASLESANAVTTAEGRDLASDRRLLKEANDAAARGEEGADAKVKELEASVSQKEVVVEEAEKESLRKAAELQSWTEIGKAQTLQANLDDKATAAAAIDSELMGRLNTGRLPDPNTQQVDPFQIASVKLNLLGLGQTVDLKVPEVIQGGAAQILAQSDGSNPASVLTMGGIKGIPQRYESFEFNKDGTTHKTFGYASPPEPGQEFKPVSDRQAAIVRITAEALLDPKLSLTTVERLRAISGKQDIPASWLTPEAEARRQQAGLNGLGDLQIPAGFKLNGNQLVEDNGGEAKSKLFGLQIGDKTPPQTVGKITMDASGVPVLEVDRNAISPSLLSGNYYRGLPEFAQEPPEYFDGQAKLMDAIDMNGPAAERSQMAKEASIPWEARRWTTDQFNNFSSKWDASNDAARAELIAIVDPSQAKLPPQERRLNADALFQSGYISKQDARLLQKSAYNTDPQIPSVDTAYKAWMANSDNPYAAQIRTIQGDNQDTTDNYSFLESLNPVALISGLVEKGEGLNQLTNLETKAKAAFLQDYAANNQNKVDFDRVSYAQSYENLMDQVPLTQRILGGGSSLLQNTFGSSLGMMVMGLPKLAGKTIADGVSQAIYGNTDSTFDTSEEMGLMLNSTGEWMRGAAAFFKDRAALTEDSPANWLSDLWSGKNNREIKSAVADLKTAINTGTLDPARLGDISKRIKTASDKLLALRDGEGQASAVNDLSNPLSDLAPYAAAYAQTADPAYLSMLENAAQSNKYDRSLIQAASDYASNNGDITESTPFGMFQQSLRGGSVAGLQEQVSEALTTYFELGLGKIISGGEHAVTSAARTGRALNLFERSMANVGKAEEWMKDAGVVVPAFGESLTAGQAARNVAVQVGKAAAGIAIPEGLEEVETGIGDSGATGSTLLQSFAQGAIGGLTQGGVMTAIGYGMSEVQKAAAAKSNFKGLQTFVGNWNAQSPSQPISVEQVVQAQSYMNPAQKLSALQTFSAATDAFVGAQNALNAERAKSTTAIGEITPQRIELESALVSARQNVATAIINMHGMTQDGLTAVQEINGLPAQDRSLVDATVRALQGSKLNLEQQQQLLSAWQGPAGEPGVRISPDGVTPIITDALRGEVAKLAPFTAKLYPGRSEAEMNLIGEAVASVPQQPVVAQPAPTVQAQKAAEPKAKAKAAPATHQVEVTYRKPYAKGDLKLTIPVTAATDAEAMQKATTIAKKAGHQVQGSRVISSTLPAASVTTPTETAATPANGELAAPVALPAEAGATSAIGQNEVSAPQSTTNADLERQPNQASRFAFDVTYTPLNSGRELTTTLYSNGADLTTARTALQGQLKALEKVGTINNVAPVTNEAASQPMESSAISQPVEQPVNQAVVPDPAAPSWKATALRSVLSNAAAAFGYKIVDTGLNIGVTDQWGKVVNLGTQMYDKLNPGSEIGQWIDAMNRAKNPVGNAIIRGHEIGLHRVWYGHDFTTNLGAIVARFGWTGVPDYIGQLLKDSLTKSGIPFPGVQLLVQSGAVSDRFATDWLSTNIGEVFGGGISFLGTYRLLRQSKAGTLTKPRVIFATIGIGLKLASGVMTAQPFLILSGLADAAILVTNLDQVKAAFKKGAELAKVNPSPMAVREQSGEDVSIDTQPITQVDAAGGQLANEPKPASTWIKTVDGAAADSYASTREEYRRNLGRSVKSAEDFARASGRTGQSLRNNTEAIDRALSLAEFPLLDAEHFRASVGDQENLGRNEHAVFDDPASGRYFKLTKENEFGAKGDYLGYVQRLQENNELFDDDLRLEGAFKNPETGQYQLLISQPQIVGRPSTKEEIAAYMEAKGFQKYSNTSWWNDGKEVLVSDVEPHNVLTDASGKVYPIDVIPDHPTGQRLEMIENTVRGRQSDASVVVDQVRPTPAPAVEPAPQPSPIPTPAPELQTETNIDPAAGPMNAKKLSTLLSEVAPWFIDNKVVPIRVEASFYVRSDGMKLITPAEFKELSVAKQKRFTPSPFAMASFDGAIWVNRAQLVKQLDGTENRREWLKASIAEELRHFAEESAVDNATRRDLWNAASPDLQDRVRLAYFKGDGEFANPEQAARELIRMYGSAIVDGSTTEQADFLREVETAAKTSPTFAEMLAKVLRGIADWLKTNALANISDEMRPVFEATVARVEAKYQELLAQMQQAPSAIVPRILPGETQGDLISSTQSEDFSLVGDKGPDNAAREAEKIASAKAAEEAKIIADQQQGNFLEPSTPDYAVSADHAPGEPPSVTAGAPSAETALNSDPELDALFDDFEKFLPPPASAVTNQSSQTDMAPPAGISAAGVKATPEFVATASQLADALWKRGHDTPAKFAKIMADRFATRINPKVLSQIWNLGANSDPDIAVNWTQTLADTAKESAKPAAEAVTTPAPPAPGWVNFPPEAQSLNVPRDHMPQVPTDARGALVNYLNARGISTEKETVAASTLKPSQAEYHPEKVVYSRENTQSRRVLVSSDNYILDGHHQVLAADGGEVNILRLNAPVREALAALGQFPSTAPVDPAVAKKNRRGFRLPASAMIQNDVLDFILEQGGMQGVTELRAKGKELGQEYDDLTSLPNPYRSILFRGSVMPDEMAQMAADQGLIKDPFVTTLVDAMNSAIQTRRNAMESAKAQEKDAVTRRKQDRAFAKDALQPGQGDEKIAVDTLQAGDTVKVDGEKLKVTAISPDDHAVTLEDHSTYGIQQVESGEVIYGQLNPDEMAARAPQAEPVASKPVANSPQMKAANDILDVMRKNKPMGWRELFSIADAAWGGTQADGTYSVKDAYDALELAVNLWIESRGSELSPGFDSVQRAQGVVRGLENLLKNLPTQTKRTTEQDSMQQFSTPPPFAFVANWVANIRPGDVVLEPSAGIGGLGVFAKNAGATVIANELSERRREFLQNLGFDYVTKENAEQIYPIFEPRIKAGTLPRPNIVVMNPPFSNAAKSGKTGQTMIGAQHVFQALQLLPEGGRLVAIVGQGMGLETPTFRQWWINIAKSYNVRANIEVDGSNYTKYGTSFDNRILVIDKTGPTPAMSTVIGGKVDEISQLTTLLKDIRNDRPGITGPSNEPSAESSGSGSVAQQPDSTAAGVVDAGAATGSDSVSDGGPGGLAGSDVIGGSEPVRPANDSGSTLGGDRPGDAGAGQSSGSGGNGAASTNPSGSQSGFVAPEQTGITVTSAESDNREIENEDDIFSRYRPSKVQIEGAQAHPANLVESASMASVPMPDAIYTPNLPREVISEGRLSDIALETLVYAGQAHQQMLPGGERRGFFIGDGTGTGKGRQIAGIMLDNLRQGRTKAVWISEKSGLIEDAKRDLRDVGVDPTKIQPINKTKVGVPLDPSDGILFSTYSTLRGGHEQIIGPVEDWWKALDAGKLGKSRLAQIAQWVGKDFDGVIAFDEAHNAGRAVPVMGKRGLQKASGAGISVVDLQRVLPKARVVYVSATGATEVENLSFADRLGIWGEGTPFTGKLDFFNKIRAGGISAMEIVARDLKAQGLYLARSISFKGIGFERLTQNLTPEQTTIYNTIATAWQTVLANLDKAMGESGMNGSRDARGKALAAFWGAQQRFFNQLLTAMEMPVLLADMEKQLADGHSAVLQIVNTNEATQKRQIANATAEASGEKADLEDLDLSPRDILLQYLDKSFPTYLYEAVADPNNPEKVIWQVAKDAENNPIEDPQALAKKQMLMDTVATLDVPGNPLEQIVNKFGEEAIAEITGRTQRVVQVLKSNGEPGQREIKIQRRSKANREVEAKEFQDGKRRILIFSDAGGTGFSFHASNKAKNQQLRIHYLVQAGWRADKALQGFGRTHRTDQAKAPIYKLVETDIAGHKRFISTIARRLAQLGALTTGERKGKGQGIFNESDNLESAYAEDALQRLIYDLSGNKVDGFTFDEFSKGLGFTKTDSNGNERNTLLDPETGALIEDKIPDVPQFLNRVLALPLDRQNALFGEFTKRLDARLTRAMEDGTYDAGTQSYKAEELHKISDEEVYKHPGTSATTRIIEIEEVNPVAFTTFDQSGRLGTTAVAQYVRNRKSGRVYALKEAGNDTAEDGSMQAVYRRIGTRTFDRLAKRDLAKASLVNGELVSNYENLEPAEAENLWTAEIEGADKVSRKKVTFLVGTMLPVWDRIQIANPKIFRMETSEGEPLLGVLIPSKETAAVRARMGASSNALSPEEAYSMVLNDAARMTLANGWELKRVYVSGDHRIEIEGLDNSQARIFERDMGGLLERIAYKPRYFIPTEETMARVLGQSPVMAVNGEVLASKAPPAGAASNNVAASPSFVYQNAYGERDSSNKPDTRGSLGGALQGLRDDGGRRAGAVPSQPGVGAKESSGQRSVSREDFAGFHAWAEKAGLILDPEAFQAWINARKQIGDGGEHSVYLDKATNRVVKITNPDVLGDGAVGHPKNIAGYLTNLYLSNREFNDDTRLEGLVNLEGTPLPQIVISQPFVQKGRDATGEEKTSYFASKGYAYDAKNDVFTKTVDGQKLNVADHDGDNVMARDTARGVQVYPIDVQVLTDGLPKIAPATGAAPIAVDASSMQLFNDNLALATWFAQHYGNIRGQAFDDLQQEARIALWTAASRFESGRGIPFEGYASTIIRNRMNSLYRKGVARDKISFDSLDEPAFSDGETATVGDLIASEIAAHANPDDVAKVRETLMKLPVKPRDIWLSWMAGKDWRTIGDEFDMSHEGARKIAQAAGTQLRINLKKLGITSADDIFPTREAYDQDRIANPVSVKADATSDDILPESDDVAAGLPETDAAPVAAAASNDKPILKGARDVQYNRSSTQVTLSEKDAGPIRDFVRSIPESELYHDPKDPTFGREMEPHITALYGITSADPKPAHEVLKTIGEPITVVLGKLSLFQNKNYDVLKVDVENGDLNRINSALREGVEFESDYPDYHPHMTLAYLKPGEGAKYVGRDDFAGKILRFNEVEFRSKDGNVYGLSSQAPVAGAARNSTLDQDFDSARARIQRQMALMRASENIDKPAEPSNNKAELWMGYQNWFRGRMDAADAIAPGIKKVFSDASREEALATSSVNKVVDGLREEMQKAFGDPSFWNRNHARLKDASRAMLPVASFLEVDHIDDDGNFVWQPFMRRGGILFASQAAKLGVNVGDSLWHDDREMTVGDFIADAGGYLLLEPVSAELQAEIYNDFRETFPEATPILDRWVMPGLENAFSQDARGTMTIEFNRYALHQLFNEWPPELKDLFGDMPMPKVPYVEGYTPDVAAQRSIINVISRLLGRYKSQGRKLKTGALAQSGNVKNLVDGFSTRAMEAHREKIRRKLREGIIKTSVVLERDVPVDQRGKDFVYLDDAFANVTKALELIKGLNPESFPALSKMAGATSDPREMARIFGETHRLAGRQWMIHKNIHRELMLSVARQGTEGILMKTLNWFLRAAKLGKLTAGSAGINWIGNEIMRQTQAINRAFYGLVSLATGDIRGAKLGLYEAGFLLRGIITDRMPNTLNKSRIAELIPRELFDDQTALAALDAGTNYGNIVEDMQRNGVLKGPGQGIINAFKQGGVSASILYAINYSGGDTAAKQASSYAAYRARAEVAADESKITKGRKEWMRNWISEQIGKGSAIHEEVMDAAKLFYMDYSNVPAWMDPSATLPEETVKRFLKAHGLWFVKWPYNMLRLVKRLGVDGAVNTVRPGSTKAERTQGLANVLTLAAIAYAGAFLLGGGGGDDKDPLIGSRLDADGNILDNNLDTSSRLNLSALGRRLRLGRILGTALRMTGISINDDLTNARGDEFWGWFRNITWMPEALMMGKGVNGDWQGFLRDAGPYIADMANMGILTRFLGLVKAGSSDAKKKPVNLLAEAGFEVLGAPVNPDAITKYVAAIIDPVSRRGKDSKLLNFELGPIDAIKAKIPGLTKDIPAAGEIVAVRLAPFDSEQWFKGQASKIKSDNSLQGPQKAQALAALSKEYKTDVKPQATSAKSFRDFMFVAGVDPKTLPKGATSSRDIVADLAQLRELGVGPESVHIFKKETPSGATNTYIAYPNPETVAVRDPFFSLFKLATGLNVKPVPKAGREEATTGIQTLQKAPSQPVMSAESFFTQSGE